MASSVPVAVASRSFSKHPVLRRELLERFPNTTFNETGASLSGAALVAFLKGHERAITALERLDDALFAAVPELKVIGKYGVGLDMIDLAAMRRRGVKLGWTGGVNKRSVSELVISAVIALLRKLPEAREETISGAWRQIKGRQVSERTIGIVGCGHIGKDLGRLLRAFGCRVLAHDILDFPDFYAETGVEPCGLDTLLAEADVVTLHLPLDDSTRGIMSADRLGRMRPDALLVNAARGGLVDEAALKARLKDGRLAGAVLDVFAEEPPEDREWVTMRNVIVTPHIGGSSEEAILNMGRAAIAGLENARVPDPDAGYPVRSLTAAV